MLHLLNFYSLRGDSGGHFRRDLGILVPLDAPKAIIYHSSLIIELFLHNFGLPHGSYCETNHKLYFITRILAPQI